MCVLIDVCVQLLLYMFRGQYKIIPQHSQSKSSTKPPSPFLTCQFKMATRPLLFSRHPIPWAIAKYTLLSLTRHILTDQTSPRSCHDCSNPTSSVKNSTELIIARHHISGEAIVQNGRTRTDTSLKMLVTLQLLLRQTM